LHFSKTISGEFLHLGDFLAGMFWKNSANSRKNAKNKRLATNSKSQI
jgi:hypothetical protein